MTMKSLTVKQKQAIHLALSGNNWSDIAKELKVTEPTLWAWRNLPEWQDEFDKAQSLMFQELAVFHGQMLNEAYRALHEIGLSKSVSDKDRVTALTNWMNRVHSNQSDKTLLELKKDVKFLKEMLIGENDDSV